MSPESKRLLDRLAKLEADAVRFRQKELRARGKAERIEREILRIRLAAGAPRDRAPTAAVPPRDRPIGVVAIRRLLGEAPGRVWTAGALHEELERRQWVSSMARHRLQGTEAAVSRLVRGGELERIERGRYRLRSADETVRQPLPPSAEGLRAARS